MCQFLTSVKLQITRRWAIIMVHLEIITATFLKQAWKGLYMTGKKIKVDKKKARWPGNINPRVLKSCAGELADKFHRLFCLSLRLKRVLWKTSCVVPVPKRTRPSTPNDYWPFALTSQVMKILERLGLKHLKPQLRDFQYPVGVEAATIYMLHRAYK